jgi:hypothetical protein
MPGDTPMGRQLVISAVEQDSPVGGKNPSD